MKKILIILTTIFALSFLALAEQSVYVYKKDGTKVQYFASTLDSIGFVNVHTITFNSNGGTGSMDVVRVKDGESITLPTNEFTNAKAEFASWNTAADGSGTAYTDQSTITPTANLTLYAQWENITSGIADGHEWVDLGLPSGTKWATCNVGADSPEDYGDYFAWGETTPKERYGWSTYKWCNGSSTTLTKYCTSSSYGTVDNKTTLDLADDAANANWGGEWRMPTKEEQDELSNTSYTTWTWTTLNGVNGYMVTSKVNGNSIFMPVAGRFYGNNRQEADTAFYWSSSLNTGYPDYVHRLAFNENYVVSGGDSRDFGNSVRPVVAK